MLLYVIRMGVSRACSLQHTASVCHVFAIYALGSGLKSRCLIEIAPIYERMAPIRSQTNFSHLDVCCCAADLVARRKKGGDLKNSVPPFSSSSSVLLSNPIGAPSPMEALLYFIYWKEEEEERSSFGFFSTFSRERGKNMIVKIHPISLWAEKRKILGPLFFYFSLEIYKVYISCSLKLLLIFPLKKTK